MCAKKSDFVVSFDLPNLIEHAKLGRQVAQSVERRWWGRMPPNQPYPKGAAPTAITLRAEWCPEIPGNGLI